MKYETAIAIGRGACGEVFKAWDPVAERDVALKLFPADDPSASPEHAARRQREARAQQRLDHPAICEIYEVGTNAQGRAFIAMRYVDGEPLDEIAARLPMRRRIELMAQIADAVAAAHGAGLIHRDLKPSNLLVEEQEDGTLAPFVLDFGIVRIADETRLTETGQVLGTPGYLSPEQARGQDPIDERSDVFSLGVVLYQVLTGVPPFAADSSVGALLKVLEHDPPLAHTVRPEVPPELAHIAHKALEKDPRRRYPDAGALRRDLDRYLAAGSVGARAVGPLGRLLRRVERNPTPWLVGALLLILALGSLGWAARNRWVAERQTRDAEAFARRSSEIEARLRFLRMLPQRPIGEGHDRLARELEQLAAVVDASNGRARAAGDFAVGRVELALGRVDAAVERLEAARRRGYREPAAALSLGRARLEQTRLDLRRVDSIRDPSVRAAERQRLLAELRSSALPALREAAAATPVESGPQLLAQALAALVMGRPEEARRLAGEVAEHAPWLFEADLIAADALREEAVQAQLATEFAVGVDALEAEREVLAAALERAPSAPVLYERQCENRLVMAQLLLAMASPRERWEEAFDEARRHCETTLWVRPGSREAGRLQAEIGWRRALQRLRWDGPAAARDDADEAVAMARAMVLAHPGETADLWNLGNALFAQANLQRQLGEPSLALLEQAAEALEDGLQDAPGLAFGWLSLGHVWLTHGQQLSSNSRDPRASYRKARQAYERGRIGSRLQQSRLLNGICLVEAELAYYGAQHPEAVADSEIEAALERSVNACQKALELDEGYLSALSNLGLTLWTEVEWRIARDRSPEVAASSGREVFRRLLELSPEHISGRLNLAGLIATATAWHLDQDADLEAPEELLVALAEAEAALAPIADRIPGDVKLQRSRLRTLEAAARCRQGRREDSAWARARNAIEALKASGAAANFAALRRAEFHRRAALCARRQGATGEFQQQVTAGLAAVRGALAIDPTWDPGLREQERLEQLAPARATE